MPIVFENARCRELIKPFYRCIPNPTQIIQSRQHMFRWFRQTNLEFGIVPETDRPVAVIAVKAFCLAQNHMYHADPCTQ
jgi:hypothetical protein